MPKKAKTNELIDFEKSLQSLEELVGRMETGELSLEESLKHFEEGVKLTRQCQQALKTAEQKVSILMKKTEDAGLEAFDADE